MYLSNQIEIHLFILSYQQFKSNPIKKKIEERGQWNCVSKQINVLVFSVPDTDCDWLRRRPAVLGLLMRIAIYVHLLAV